ncbi:UNVERIFIED_CONTAM: hypothetical protein PYX00_002051 [Menopon gallinae]|uniref:USP domain-containing protein n=1 Tax=Menopon gallinae TaxID=328185 RepID=A0AAW2IEV2_9NEOP
MAPLSELDMEQMRSGNHGHQASRDSGQFTNTKGLLNGPGQNNCFLNSAVQVRANFPINFPGFATCGTICLFGRGLGLDDEIIPRRWTLFLLYLTLA